jgi:hypothetical protein
MPDHAGGRGRDRSGGLNPRRGSRAGTHGAAGARLLLGHTNPNPDDQRSHHHERRLSRLSNRAEKPER